MATPRLLRALLGGWSPTKQRRRREWGRRWRHLRRRGRAWAGHGLGLRRLGFCNLPSPCNSHTGCSPKEFPPISPLPSRSSSPVFAAAADPPRSYPFSKTTTFCSSFLVWFDNNRKLLYTHIWYICLLKLLCLDIFTPPVFSSVFFVDTCLARACVDCFQFRSDLNDDFRFNGVTFYVFSFSLKYIIQLKINYSNILVEQQLKIVQVV